MVHKCSLMKVSGAFFDEPTTIHFIKEISRKVDLAPTSVRNNIKELLKENLIIIKKSAPFNGFVANRENEDFLFYKRLHNIYSLKDLARFLVSSYYPKLMIIYGSFSIGEDIETSDIDIFILTKVKKNIDIKRFEKELNRKIHLIVVDDLNKIDNNLKKKLYNGIVLHGGFDG